MGILTVSQSYDPTDAENVGEEVTETNFNSLSYNKGREYYSDGVGNYIVDAITGAKYPWLVGSLDERRFFRVTNTNPNSAKKGDTKNYDIQSSGKAFYENPYAYMKYNNVELNEHEIKLWYDNANIIYPGEYIYHA
jgi:hypothetical protein